METTMKRNNQVTIEGRVKEPFAFDHESYGEKFFRTTLLTSRLSGTLDEIPVTISERLIDLENTHIGDGLKITGQFRSFNKQVHNGKSHLVLFVFANEIDVFEVLSGTQVNDVYLDGFICKKPVYRKTPLGREIAEVLLAVNRPYGKSDYIPCILWGRNAKYVEDLEVGSHLSVNGRIQSREYQKKLSEEESETRVAYEVSVSQVSYEE